MQTTFEKLGGTYRQVGDYLFPDIEAPESPAISIWGQRRLQYLRTTKRVLHNMAVLILLVKYIHSKQGKETFAAIVFHLAGVCQFLDEDTISRHTGIL